MSMNLYVGNLSYSVGNSELQALFAEHGTVKSANVIMDPTHTAAGPLMIPAEGAPSTLIT